MAGRQALGEAPDPEASRRRARKILFSEHHLSHAASAFYWYYGLIERFGRPTGVPILLNTSFNLRGEPIVNTRAEAFSTFARSGMDALVLGDCIVDKTQLAGRGL